MRLKDNSRVDSRSAQLGKSLSTIRERKVNNAAQLMKSGQHDRTPVTTKHEKRLYANPVCTELRLFSREAISLIEGVLSVIEILRQLRIPSLGFRRF
jgi:hypothetical protein